MFLFPSPKGLNLPRGPPSLLFASETFCSAIRQPVHEVDHSPPSCDEIKNVRRYTSIHRTWMHGAFFTPFNNVVLVTSSKLLVGPKSGGGLGEWPAPYPHRSADLRDPTAMTRHVARPQLVHGARLLSGGLKHRHFF
jgi:hypothetical protein